MQLDTIYFDSDHYEYQQELAEGAGMAWDDYGHSSPFLSQALICEGDPLAEEGPAPGESFA